MYIYIYIYIYLTVGKPDAFMANVLDCNIMATGIKIQSRY